MENLLCWDKVGSVFSANVIIFVARLESFSTSRSETLPFPSSDAALIRSSNINISASMLSMTRYSHARFTSSNLLGGHPQSHPLLFVINPQYIINISAIRTVLIRTLMRKCPFWPFLLRMTTNAQTPRNLYPQFILNASGRQWDGAFKKKINNNEKKKNFK